MELPVLGDIRDINSASENLKFASAVSEFGMILRNSECKGNSTFDSAVSLAKEEEVPMRMATG